MSERDGLIVHHEEFAHKVHLFARLAGRDLREVFESTAKGIVKRAVTLTPPFSARNRTITAAKAAGEATVRADFRRLFRPVEIKGQRKIPLLFGKDHPSAPWFTPTVEKHPNVAALYRQHRILDRAGRSRNYRQPFYVDQRKHETEIKRRLRKVGYLGAGFLPAARALGVTVPGFMKRHASAPGQYQQTTSRDRLRIVFTNAVGYASRVGGGDLRRRIDYAVRYQMNAMDRQIPHLLRRRSSAL